MTDLKREPTREVSNPSTGLSKFTVVERRVRPPVFAHSWFEAREMAETAVKQDGGSIEGLEVEIVKEPKEDL